MFNQSMIPIGTWYIGKYYEWESKSKTYGNAKTFRYKTYDDTQYVERRNQPMPGDLGSKFSVSIKTYDNLPFKVKDKVELIDESKNFQITSVVELKNVGTSLKNMMFPKTKGNKPRILHLNKDDF